MDQRRRPGSACKAREVDGSHPRACTITAAPDAAEDAALESLVQRQLGDRWQARGGELIDVLASPVVLVAERDGEVVGVACCGEPGGDPPEVELIALATDPHGQGAGGGLIDAVMDRARGEGVSAVWLVTTNDNLRALRFYQRRGFRLRALHPNAVTRARQQVKPGIPLTGEDGIPVRDEIELVRPV